MCGCLLEKKDNNFERVNSKYYAQKTGKISNRVTESSGLAFTAKKNTYWTINDSGGGPELFEINEKGNLLHVINLPGLENNDWEDLTSAPDGTLFIGDFGNNNYSRDSVQINILNTKLVPEGTIKFKYSESNGNPTGKENCEAFFFHAGSLYLFSKSENINGGVTRLYRLPAQPGNYEAELIDEIAVKGQVTSADINPDGQSFVLLTYGKLLFFDITQDRIDFKAPAACLKMVKKQTEAIMYLNTNDLLITNEQRDVFRVSERKN